MPSKDYRVWLSDFAYIVMELTAKSGSRSSVPLPPLPKKPRKWRPYEIERWLRSIGAKPVDAATKRRLQAAGHWGMPEE